MGSDANGFLLPSWYVAEEPSETDLNIASIIWGFSLACAVFTFAKALQHSWKAHKRGRLQNVYIVTLWAEWVVCVALSIVSWLYLSPSLSIQPGFWIFFWLLALWVVQIQCILQIIINRVRLLMGDQRKADHLKWGVAIFVGLINISVFIIWIPARLQISQEWIDINVWWDRTEKTLFGLCDACLNLYFIYLVRSKLISNGLKKYEKLLRFNILMIIISVSLDAALIGLMSIPDSPVYFQFHPLAYLVKLHIEMNLAELIGKIVKASNPLNGYTDDNVLTCVITSSNGNSGSGAMAKLGSNLPHANLTEQVPDLKDKNKILGQRSMAAEVAFDGSSDLEAGRFDSKHENSNIRATTNMSFEARTR